MEWVTAAPTHSLVDMFKVITVLTALSFSWLWQEEEEEEDGGTVTLQVATSPSWPAA